MTSPSSINEAKLNASEYTCRYLSTAFSESVIIGVGTGSTVKVFIEKCRDFLRSRLLVPSSLDTAITLASMGFTSIADPAVVDEIDVYVDGADEVSRRLDLVKGRGGAFLREKTLALRSKMRVYIVDYTKYTGASYLYAKPIPIEIIPISVKYTLRKLKELGYGEPVIRAGSGKDGPIVSDNGNLIVDYHLVKPVENPLAFHNTLKLIHGVVETGIFPSEQLVDMVVVGEPVSVRVLKPAGEYTGGQVA
ncbi:MAG: ribose 5-phosphate isomerase A [Desulfurococcus sp.]|nr:ribose 5-phosphate isomerase A [Desulfurococcus sp.]